MLHMLQWLYTMLQRYVPNVSFVFSDILLQVCLTGCCIRYTHMLQVFYLDIAYVCNVFQVFHKDVSSDSYMFRRMLQVLHLDVQK